MRDRDECPRCRLINPPGHVNCDTCGWPKGQDFFGATYSPHWRRRNALILLGLFVLWAAVAATGGSEASILTLIHFANGYWIVVAAVWIAPRRARAGVGWWARVRDFVLVLLLAWLVLELVLSPVALRVFSIVRQLVGPVLALLVAVVLPLAAACFVALSGYPNPAWWAGAPLSQTVQGRHKQRIGE